MDFDRNNNFSSNFKEVQQLPAFSSSGCGSKSVHDHQTLSRYFALFEVRKFEVSILARINRIAVVRAPSNSLEPTQK